MKLLPEGFRVLLAPAAMLPAALPRPDAPPMVPAELAPMLGVPAAKDGGDTFEYANDMASASIDVARMVPLVMAVVSSVVSDSK